MLPEPKYLSAFILWCSLYLWYSLQTPVMLFKHMFEQRQTINTIYSYQRKKKCLCGHQGNDRPLPLFSHSAPESHFLTPEQLLGQFLQQGCDHWADVTGCGMISTKCVHKGNAQLQHIFICSWTAAQLQLSSLSPSSLNNTRVSELSYRERTFDLDFQYQLQQEKLKFRICYQRFNYPTLSSCHQAFNYFSVYI